MSLQPSPPDLSSSTGTPTPGTSTVVTPSIVLPPELRPLTSKTAAADSGGASPSQNALNLDLSLPLSTLLRESTKIAHTQAEHSPGAIALAGGTLPFREYVRYLASLWIVYTVLEREIARHATHTTDGEADVLGLLWDEKKGGKGRMLSRSEALAKDVAYLVSLKPASEWTTDPRDTPSTTSTHSSMPTPPFPVPPFLKPLFTASPPAITEFTNHLTQISATRPALLLAHAYVRYLGDLSGGQIVRSRIRRVYTLDPPSTNPSSSEITPTQTQDGTQFYEFDIFDSSDRPLSPAGEPAQPTMYERKQRMSDIKDWFRSVLDSGTADNAEDLKRAFPPLLSVSPQSLTFSFDVGALVGEAIESFHLSTHIFSALRPTSPTISSEATSPATPSVAQLTPREFTPDRPASIVTWQWLGLLALYAAWMAYRYAF